MLNTPSRDENKAIDAFLTHFNYLGKDKKRAGFTFFMRRELTECLEKIGSELQTHLNELKATKILSGSQDRAFLNLIIGAVNAARNARSEMGKVSNEFEIIETPFSKKLIRIDIDFKTPYANAKFEKNLVQGLRAASPFLDATHQGVCNSLIENIVNFVPEKEVIEDRSFIP